MRYVDGYLLPLPKKNLAAYRKMSGAAGKIWKKHGALQYVECVAEDMHPEGIKLVFPKLMKLKPDETAVFSFVVYKSRKHRDQVNAKVFADPFMSDSKHMDKPMPFDMKRMAFGGFEAIVDL